MNENLTSRRLYRSRLDRKIAGVAGGLGQYFNVDPVWFRLGFVVLVLTPPGIGLLAYIVLAIVMPNRPNSEDEPAITYSGLAGSREVVGYLLLGFGLLWLAANLGLFRIFAWGHLWPLLLIGVGVLLIVNRLRD